MVWCLFPSQNFWIHPRHLEGPILTSRTVGAWHGGLSHIGVSVAETHMPCKAFHGEAFDQSYESSQKSLGHCTPIKSAACDLNKEKALFSQHVSYSTHRSFFLVPCNLWQGTAVYRRQVPDLNLVPTTHKLWASCFHRTLWWLEWTLSLTDSSVWRLSF